MELSIENVAWFAGLFEGEGCISPDYQKDKRNTSGQPTPRYYITITMTDKDVITRLKDLFGGRIYDRPPQKEGWKHQYRWFLYEKEKVRTLLAASLPYFGDRRAHRALNKLDLIELSEHDYATRNSPLTETQVRTIRNSDLSNSQLATQFGVNTETVRRARLCKTYQWV